ncbi:protein of unknown function [Faunimonas pinastri]|uniref:DUF4112 domain-containing protein n=2 Tax=Faunimonas pinastri TaxID=1855383 RepID=A0A1H9M2L3_9HYPH|nr:protein of unknown function [Faunimonas pinastri]
MEFWLDRRFRIPIAGIHIGLDGLLGLIPVVGDGAGALISLWLVWEAHRMGADGWTKGRMLLNILIDFFIGSVPVVGDIADFLFKSNTLNMRLLRRHLAEMEERDWQPLR